MSYLGPRAISSLTILTQLPQRTPVGLHRTSFQPTRASHVPGYFVSPLRPSTPVSATLKQGWSPAPPCPTISPDELSPHPSLACPVPREVPGTLPVSPAALLLDGVRQVLPCFWGSPCCSWCLQCPNGKKVVLRHYVCWNGGPQVLQTRICAFGLPKNSFGPLEDLCA